MALLRNREVSIVGVTGGEDPSQQFTVQTSDGTKEQAPLRDLTLSESEQEDFAKRYGDRFTSQISTIKDKDYQAIKDAQDPEKIKKAQDKQSDTPVSVPVQVKPSDVVAAQ